MSVAKIETAIQYRFREFGPKSNRMFMVECSHGGDSWYPCPWSPDFVDIEQARQWLDDFTSAPLPSVYHPYP